MAMSVTKTSQEMKNKSLLSTEKTLQNQKNALLQL